MEGRHSTNRAIVRGLGRWDNAVRRDEKNGSPFSIVYDFQEWASGPSPGRNGFSLPPDAPFTSVPPIIPGEGRSTQLRQINCCASSLPLGDGPGSEAFRVGQKTLLPNKNAAWGPRCIGANLPESAPDPNLPESAPDPACVCASLTALPSWVSFLFLSYGNRRLHPLICPCLHPCQQGLSAAHHSAVSPEPVVWGLSVLTPTAAALASTLVTGRLISAHLTATPFMESFLSKISRLAHKLTHLTWYRSEHAVNGSKDG